MEEKSSMRRLRLLSTVAGSAICVLLAVVTWKMFPSKIALAPIVFIGVAFAMAWLFGSSAGILGSLGCALFFAYVFSPHGSFRVASGTARTNLEWLLLVGIPACYLFVPHKDGLLISRKE